MNHSLKITLFLALFFSVISSPHAKENPDSIAIRHRLPLSAQTLHHQDIKRYQQIFSLQQKGLFKRSDLQIQKLDNNILIGYVLEQRYLHPQSGKISYAKLAHWLQNYADHPQANKIYKLALKRKPKTSAFPKKPHKPYIPSQLSAEETNRAEKRFTKSISRKKWRRLCTKNQALKLIRKRKFAEAETLLRNKQWQKKRANNFMTCRLLIARSLFLNEHDLTALYVANIKGNSPYAAELYWWGGLAAFRQQRTHLAVTSFTKSSLLIKPGNNNDLASAAFYWTARSWLRLGKPDQALKMWEESYRIAPFSFYGQLAAESIGYGIPYNWKEPSAKKILSINKKLQFPAARRTVALAQIGKKDMAIAEMHRFIKNLSRQALATYMVLAHEMDMTNIAYAIAYKLERDYNTSFHASLYPLPLWQPSDGFKLDPKLIYAFVRQESGFNPNARSSADARGLMQLMPATARFMHKGNINKKHLYEPSLNLSLGQKYLLYLIGEKNLGDHMLRMVASYNAGPGNVMRWMERSDFSHNDPLLYIESLPWIETRHFVKNVMRNFWAYHEKYNIKPQTRRMLAEGKWPVYSLDGISSQNYNAY